MGCKMLAQHPFITHRGFEPPRFSVGDVSALSTGTSRPRTAGRDVPLSGRGAATPLEEGGRREQPREQERAAKEKRPPLSVFLGRGTGGSALAGGRGRCLSPGCLFLLSFQQGFRKGPEASGCLPSSPLVLVSIAVAAQAEKSCSQELQRLSGGCNIFP